MRKEGAYNIIEEKMIFKDKTLLMEVTILRCINNLFGTRGGRGGGDRGKSGDVGRGDQDFSLSLVSQWGNL